MTRNLFLMVVFLISNTCFSTGVQYRACMTDVYRYYFESPERIQKRFEIYKDFGVDMLRIEGMGWSNLEVQEGQWRDVIELRNYIDLVKKNDFKIKLIAGTIMTPPGWYIDNNPDVQLINEDGVVCRNSLNYWNLEIRTKLEQVTDKLFAYYKKTGLLDRVEQVVIDFGQAGEPLYPPAWTLGPDYKGGETFWMYNRLANQDFRDKMREKYHAVEIANAVWNTDFENWEDVRIYKPGVKSGAYWNDVLLRYRDVKRDFIVWQIDNFKKAIIKYSDGRIKPVVYLAGNDCRDSMWADAVKTGKGNFFVKLMCDLRWLAKTAVEKGCVLQYTGVNDRPEVEYIVKYLRDNDLEFQMWGENAGSFDCAKDPLELADIIIQNGLCGLDYTHSHFIFKTRGSPKAAWEETEADVRAYTGDIELNPDIAPELKKAYKEIKDHYISRERK